MLQGIDDVALDTEQAEFEDLEQAGRAGADDGDLRAGGAGRGPGDRMHGEVARVAVALGEEGVAPLMKNWSSNPVDIKAAIGGYDRSASSSNSETTLLAAMKLLAEI